MRVSDLPGAVRCGCLLPLVTVSASGQAVPQGTPAVPKAQAEAVVASLYKEVVARHPIAGMGDRKIFARYLSKGLLRRFDDNTVCLSDWYRQNPGTIDKPPFGRLEMGVYSGSDEESTPQTFHIEKTESGEDGSYRVYVKLSYAGPTFRMLWHVVALVVRENSQSVVDDVIYLSDKDRPDEGRLSQVLAESGCSGPRYRG
ncbi:MAG: hypothetical protein ACTHJR_05885 [Sphingomonas sp.]|uniref:hypothetical protein n=1 Tax=Sphingomonas sp. TaxID=28214 RepID=UPI003F8036C2